MDPKSCVNCDDAVGDFDGSYAKSRSRMMCFVPSCKQKYEPGISFHVFPARTDKKRYRTWLNHLRLKVEPLTTSRVCSLHFTIGNFIAPKTGKLIWFFYKIHKLLTNGSV